MLPQKTTIFSLPRVKFLSAELNSAGEFMWNDDIYMRVKMRTMLLQIKFRRNLIRWMLRKSIESGCSSRQLIKMRLETSTIPSIN
jgi:hypothetical protein